VANAGCAPCGFRAPDASFENPILNQKCPLPPRDAGLDANEAGDAPSDAPSDAPPPDPACDKCKDDHCCETRQACRDDPDCEEAGFCLQACANNPAPQCNLDCFAAHPEGSAVLVRFETCSIVFCAEACAGANACIQCTNAKCVEEFVACNADLACDQLQECLGDCNQLLACQNDCYRAYPGTPRVELNAFFNCAQSKCRTECGG
jgi:hypothetical protein